MDLLEPMRRAAELGCPDFVVTLNGVVFKDMHKGGWYLPGSNSPVSLESARAFRYAACRCECWWREQYETRRNDRVAQVDRSECLEMIDLCRAFANEHGV